MHSIPSPADASLRSQPEVPATVPGPQIRASQRSALSLRHAAANTIRRLGPWGRTTPARHATVLRSVHFPWPVSPASPTESLQVSSRNIAGSKTRLSRQALAELTFLADAKLYRV